MEKKKSITEQRITVKRETITESVKLLNSDKEKIYKLINMPRNMTIVLNSYQEYPAEERTIIFSRRSGTMYLFSYNLDLDEVTNFLVDLCDDFGYQFRTYMERHVNTMNFEVFVHS